MRIKDVGLLWMTSNNKFGASLKDFKYPERLVIFKVPPVGSLQ